MCGRFTLTSPVEQIQELFGVRELPNLEPRFNVAPTQDVLTLREIEDAAREAVMMRWGLVPFWAEDVSIGNRMINARSETVQSKPAFREAFERRRCLVAADSFLEWKKSGSTKQPYMIRMQDRRPFAMAGLWERWRSPEGTQLLSCTILTTVPNALVSGLHDRMPVILDRADHSRWLDRDADPREVAGMLRPFDEQVMEAVAVSTRVNSVANDDPQCLDPVEVQGTLI